MSVSDKREFTVVNHRVEKIDALALACGTAQFTDDLDIRGLLIGRLTRKALIAEFHDMLLDTCGAYASTLRSDYEEALRIVFQDYADSLSAIRRHLAAEKRALEPRLRRWNEVFLTLKAIEQDL